MKLPSARPFRTRRAVVLAVAAFALAGCAGLNRLDSDVSSYSHWPAGRAPATYAFERLPSQQAQPEEQAALETAARDALAHAGFTEAAEASASDVTVQLSARVTRQDAWPYDDPWGWRWGWRSSWWGPRWGTGLGYESSRYAREVAVLIRDRRTGQPLYETRATSDGLSGGDAATWAAMFEAALKDFPQPAVNPRRVRVPLA